MERDTHTRKGTQGTHARTLRHEGLGRELPQPLDRRARQDVFERRGHQQALRRQDGHVPDAPLGDAPLRVELDAEEAALCVCV